MRRRLAERYRRCAVAATLALALALRSDLRPAAACDWCELPTSQHRTGPYTVTLAVQRANYFRWNDVRIRIRLTNRRAAPMYVDVRAPVWERVSFHMLTPKNGGLSRADFPTGMVHDVTIAPGSTYTFTLGRDLLGRDISFMPLSFWGGWFADPGTYYLDVSYAGVDSNTVAFTLLRRR